MFSFKKEEEEGEAAIKQLRKKFASNNIEPQNTFKFKINFNRYKTIFANSIP